MQGNVVLTFFYFDPSVLPLDEEMSITGPRNFEEILILTHLIGI